MKNENVDRPIHYQGKKFDAIDVIEEFDLGFNLGNAIKYIIRAGKKEDYIEDLKKSYWYIQREITNRIASEDSNYTIDTLKNMDSKLNDDRWIKIETIEPRSIYKHYEPCPEVLVYTALGVTVARQWQCGSWSDNNLCNVGGVTHWRPLPESPLH